MGNTEFGKNVRILVTRGRPGHYRRGERGRLIRPEGNGAWLVKLDSRFAGTTVNVVDMVRDAD